MKNKRVLAILFAFVLMFFSGIGAVSAASCSDWNKQKVKCEESGYGGDIGCMYDSGNSKCLTKNEKCSKYSKQGCITSRCLVDGDNCKEKNERCSKYDTNPACKDSTSGCIIIGTDCEKKTDCRKANDENKCENDMTDCIFIENKCRKKSDVKCKKLDTQVLCEKAEKKGLGCVFTAGECIQGQAGDTGDDTQCRGYDDNEASCIGEAPDCYWVLDSGKCKGFSDCKDLSAGQCTAPYAGCTKDGVTNECRDTATKDESDTECAPNGKEDCEIKENCNWFEPELVCVAKEGFLGIGTGQNKEARRLCNEAIDMLNTPNISAYDQEQYEEQQNINCSDSAYIDPYQGPIFEGPGLKAGAQMSGSYLDASISKERSLPKLAAAWTGFVLQLAAVLAVIAFIAAGVFYITDFGDGARIESAKKIIIWTTVGILLILGSYAIVNTLMKARFGDTDRGAIVFEIVSQLKV